MLRNVLLYLKSALAGYLGLAVRILVFWSGCVFMMDNVDQEISPWWLVFLIAMLALAHLANQATTYLAKQMLNVE